MEQQVQDNPESLELGRTPTLSCNYPRTLTPEGARGLMGSARFESLGSNNQDPTLKPFTEMVQCGLGRSGQLLDSQCLMIFIGDFGVCMSGGPGLPALKFHLLSMYFLMTFLVVQSQGFCPEATYLLFQLF